MAIKTFTAGEVLTAADTNAYLNNGGLVYITQASNSATNAISINNCFTSTYQNYKVFITQSAISSTVTMNIRFRVGGSDDTTANTQYMANTATAAGGSSVLAGANQSELTLGFVGTASPNAGSVIEIFSPQAAARTWGTTQRYEFDSANYVARSGSFVKDEVTSYDGLTLFAASAATFTGTVFVYGYRNS